MLSRMEQPLKDANRQQLVGAALRRLRTDAGLSQQALVDQVNIRTGANWFKATLARVEQGQRTLSFDEAAVLTSLLGTTLDGLLADAYGDAAADAAALNRATRDLIAATDAAQDALDRIRELRRRSAHGETTTATEDALARMARLTEALDG